jgi:hypothetical protein
MKKHPAEAMEVMQALGFEKVEERTIPWRESEHFRDLPFPGANIAGLRHREGLTQVELSQKTGIPRRHISEMASALWARPQPEGWQRF